MCPWNVRFSRTLPDGSPFAPREFLVDKDASQLARTLLSMTQEQFSVAFRNSPMKRAKLRGLQRNAAVVSESLGASDHFQVIERAPAVRNRLTASGEDGS